MSDTQLVCGPVADAMARRVQQWQAGGDRRAIFLDCYLRMTRNMLAALAAGEFRNGAWVDGLLCRFADYYFDALAAYDRTDPATPPVWRVAHDAAATPGTMTLQNLLLGVNAHINYDLVLTLVDVLAPEWASLTETERHARYVDYSYVNDVIARTIDVVQDEIVERVTPVLQLVDDLLGPVDEWVTEKVIVDWREEVWRHALAMLAAADDAERAVQRSAVEAATLRRAGLLLGRIEI